jgi:hypothetical protein
MPVNIDEVHAEVTVESSGGAGGDAHTQRVLPAPREVERWRRVAQSQALDDARAYAFDRDD